MNISTTQTTANLAQNVLEERFPGVLSVVDVVAKQEEKKLSDLVSRARKDFVEGKSVKANSSRDLR